MLNLSRADNSVMGRWWWTVDRWTLATIGALIGVGYVMMLAASPAVATRIGMSPHEFIFKQVVFLALAAIIVVGISMLSPREIRQLAIGVGLLALALTALTLVHGVEIKGARRWIALPRFSLQPSEFLKPCFAVVTAWLLAERRRHKQFPGLLIALGIYAVILLLLKSQPDIGMLVVVTSVLFVQAFTDGLNVAIVILALLAMGAALVGAYYLFPHVHVRVDKFLHPKGQDNYQVDMALKAFGNGGFWGRGPGEGQVKYQLPDAHADFVYAVAGEEFGMITCLLVIFLFLFIVLRALLRMLAEQDRFVVLAASGLVAGLGLQAFVNMASTLHLIPTKGMTMPFISYGGSSALAVALQVGMLLALTRKRHGGGWMQASGMRSRA